LKGRSQSPKWESGSALLAAGDALNPRIDGYLTWCRGSQLALACLANSKFQVWFLFARVWQCWMRTLLLWAVLACSYRSVVGARPHVYRRWRLWMLACSDSTYNRTTDSVW